MSKSPSITVNFFIKSLCRALGWKYVWGNIAFLLKKLVPIGILAAPSSPFVCSFSPQK